MSSPITPRIYAHVTRTTFLNIEDSLQIGKVKFFGGEYQNGSGASKTLTHYVDTVTLRPFLHDMLWSKRIGFKDYKGGTKDGRTQSRILTISTHENGYFIELANGPGTLTETGAIQPAGKPEQTANVFLSFPLARQLAADVLEYIAAWRTVALMYNLETTQPDPIAEDDDSGPDTGDADDEFEKAFPKQPDYEANRKLHRFLYSDGREVPDNPETRAIYDAYYEEVKRRPTTAELKEWWAKNKPPKT